MYIKVWIAVTQVLRVCRVVCEVVDRSAFVDVCGESLV